MADITIALTDIGGVEAGDVIYYGAAWVSPDGERIGWETTVPASAQAATVNAALKDAAVAAAIAAGYDIQPGDRRHLVAGITSAPVFASAASTADMPTGAPGAWTWLTVVPSLDPDRVMLSSGVFECPADFEGVWEFGLQLAADVPVEAAVLRLGPPLFPLVASFGTEIQVLSGPVYVRAGEIIGVAASVAAGTAIIRHLPERSFSFWARRIGSLE